MHLVKLKDWLKYFYVMVINEISFKYCNDLDNYNNGKINEADAIIGL